MNQSASKSKPSIEETIEKVTEALRVGVNSNLCYSVLINDGYPVDKAALIIRWAIRMKSSQSLSVAETNSV